MCGHSLLNWLLIVDVPGLDMIMESGDDYVVNELEKTKRKLKDISTSLDSQQMLLRLIVQVTTVNYFYSSIKFSYS